MALISFQCPRHLYSSVPQDDGALLEQELVDGDGTSSRRKRTIYCWVGVASAVLVAVGLIILLALVAKRTSSDDTTAAAMEASGKRPVELQDVLTGIFYPEGFNGTWVSDTAYMYRTENGDIALYDEATDQKQIVLSKQRSRMYHPGRHWLSPDHKYLLFADNIRKLFRHSFLASYRIYSIENDKIWDLNPPTWKSSGSAPLQLVKWAPTGNSLVYVYIGNIFYRKDITIDDANQDQMITTSGSPLTVFNGVPDWVYEEEILSSNSALWFSPDGSQLVYASFDDSQVEVMQLPIYGDPGDSRFQYPLMETIHYPKPGTPNPKVKLWVADLSNGSTRTWDVPLMIRNTEQHFTEVAWSNKEEVAVAWTNRVQNVTIIQICNTRQDQCEDVLTLTEPHGWLDAPQMKFNSDGSQFLLIQSQPQGDKGNFKHITLITRTGGKTSSFPVTSGEFTVTSILNWDQNERKVSYLGTDAFQPGQQHMYEVHDGTSGKRGTPLCVTCLRNSTDGSPCGYNTIKQSSAGSFYTHTCDGPGIPEVSLYDKNHRFKRIVTINNNLRRTVDEFAMPQKMNLQVPLKDGFTAEVTLKLPPNLDVKGSKKYPLFINVYAGPDSQLVTDSWKVDWGTYLSSAKDVIYGSIDARGSARKGDSMLFQLYRRLGTVEVEDQIAVTKYLQDTLPFVDPRRAAIWGWSYGGFVTAMTMATDMNDVFRCGISVAPVTSWMYYDTLYTERYMALPTPDDNQIHYNLSDVSQRVENFRNKKFLLAHGTGDDNVHYQQSMVLAKALEEEDILFTQLSYPDENHGINRLKKHLYHSLGEFIDECFEIS